MSALSLFKRFKRDECGATAVVYAILLPVLVEL
jgi:Flp pilus assembly pilin Flp